MTTIKTREFLEKSFQSLCLKEKSLLVGYEVPAFFKDQLAILLNLKEGLQSKRGGDKRADNRNKSSVSVNHYHFRTGIFKKGGVALILFQS